MLELGNDFISFLRFFNGNVLDLGCGKTDLQEVIRNMPGVNYFGLDKNPEMAGYNVTIHEIKQDVPLPYKNHSMNIIISCDFLEHLDWETVKWAFKEMKRIIKKKPKGYICLRFPDYTFQCDEHLTLFDDEKVLGLIKGFEIIRMSHIKQRYLLCLRIA